MTRLKLYLDVDGVLLGPETSRAWPDMVRTSISETDGGLQRRFPVDYSPARLEALQHFIEGHDAELIWLTTWVRERMITRKLTRKLRWRVPSRVAPYAARQSADARVWTFWKAQFVLSDHEPGVPAIWIDDMAVPHHRAQVTEELPDGTEILMMAPDEAVGLTPMDIDELHRWARERTGVECSGCPPEVGGE